MYVPKMCLLSFVAKSPCGFLATPITRLVRVSYASGRCPFSKIAAQKIAQIQLRRCPSTLDERAACAAGAGRTRLFLVRTGASRPRFTSHHRSHTMSLTILCVEDSQLIVRLVCNLLTSEGWRVEVYADGNAALNRLAGAVRYDLLLFDNELPHVSGMELTRYARRLPRYQQTPIIMLSAGDCGNEARGAGVDEFLRKPDEIERLVDAVKKLLNI
jgi:two-component system chemotaxis response regulator CheY